MFMKNFSLILLALSLSFCNSTNKVQSEGKNTSKKEMVLNGSYKIATLFGKDISEHKLTIAFDAINKNASGYAGCNAYSSGYTLENNAISFGFPMASKRYCEKSGAIEKEFFKALSEIKQLKIETDKIHLLTSDQEIILATKEN